MERIALAIMAHPDDAELLCAGTLALLKTKGWSIHITTMTAGDCGTKTKSSEEISEIRKKEAERSAKILGGTYECLGFKDLFIPYDEKAIKTVLRHIRSVNPIMVFTMSPSCYMVDHEVTSKLAQTACFGGGVVNIPTLGYAPLDYIPHLYYMDAIEGKDKYGKEITPGMVVDISGVIDTKTEMLKCHASQREWLREHHGMDEYIDSMHRFAEERGKLTGAKYGEGFRQHLGHAFPQDNLLQAELGESVKTPPF